MSQEIPAATVDDLHKSYGEVSAVNGLSFSLPRGTVLGLLGPNGAGKTSVVRILSTLLPFDQGSVTVLGKDLRREARAIRAQIGLTGQNAALDEYLTAYENLDMIGRLHRLGAVNARRRATELLETFELTEVAQRLVKSFSGGMRRRLDLAASLVVDPPLLILDEPTTGLDPRSRRTVWDMVRDLVSSGSSVLLTTQYLEEADRLADEVIVVDRGTALARGAPEDLKNRIGGSRVEVHLSDSGQITSAAKALEGIGTGPAQVDVDEGIVSIPAPQAPRLLATTVRRLDDLDVLVEDVRLSQPTLDDVFLTLTGPQAAAGDLESNVPGGLA